MSVSQFIRHTCAMFGLAVLTAAVWAQPAKKEAPAQKEFVPEVGQSGKDVVWVPTAQTLVDKMLDMAKLTPNDLLYDLGSGDGRTVITAAKRGARAFGIEYNPDMVELSRRNAQKEGVGDKAVFKHGDIFAPSSVAEYTKATVVTLFLLPSLNVKLRPTLLDMKPGTRVVANSFDMGDWKPDQTARVEGDCTSWCTAYLWIVPAKVAGTWKLPQGELTLQQEYQIISGTLRSGSQSSPISKATLNGDRISFTAGGAVYSGRVNGNVIEGTVAAGGKTSPWSATRS